MVRQGSHELDEWLTTNGFFKLSRLKIGSRLQDVRSAVKQKGGISLRNATFFQTLKLIRQ